MLLGSYHDGIGCRTGMDPGIIFNVTCQDLTLDHTSRIVRYTNIKCQLKTVEKLTDTGDPYPSTTPYGFTVIIMSRAREARGAAKAPAKEWRGFGGGLIGGAEPVPNKAAPRGHAGKDEELGRAWPRKRPL